MLGVDEASSSGLPTRPPLFEQARPLPVCLAPDRALHLNPPEPRSGPGGHTLACGLLRIGDGPAASPLASQRQPSWYLSKLPWPRWLQSWRGLFSCGLARSEPRLAPGNAASQSSAYTRSATRVTYGPS